MNIMMIEPLDDGGIAHYAFKLIEALSQKGQRHMLFTSRNFELAGSAEGFEVNARMFLVASLLVKRFPYLSGETRFPSLLRRSIKLLEYPFDVVDALWTAKKKKIDIVHFQTVNLIEILMICAFRLSGAKIVFTVHNVMPRHGALKFYHTTAYRIMYALCDELIIHSRSGKEEIIELFSVAPNKISVIPHGDYKFFVPETGMSPEEAKVSLGISPSAKTVLFFGAIRPNKGLDNLLMALPFIKRDVPDIKLLIVGEPCENYNRYRDTIMKEGLQEQVFEKLDYIRNDEVGKYFFASDLVVLPYNEITQSGVLQIAYAFGKPVVTTAIGGFNEAVENGKNGFLVPPGDIRALADKIAEVLKDGNALREMGEYSRYLSDTKYSWDTIATQTQDIYNHLISKAEAERPFQT